MKKSVIVFFRGIRDVFIEDKSREITKRKKEKELCRHYTALPLCEGRTKESFSDGF